MPDEDIISHSSVSGADGVGHNHLNMRNPILQVGLTDGSESERLIETLQMELCRESIPTPRVECTCHVQPSLHEFATQSRTAMSRGHDDAADGGLHVLHTGTEKSQIRYNATRVIASHQVMSIAIESVGIEIDGLLFDDENRTPQRKDVVEMRG